MARGRRQRRPQTQGTSCVTIHSHYACTPVFVRLFNGPISSDTCEGGVWDNLRERRSPLLGKGGDAAPSSKWSRSFGGAAGVVRSTSDNRWLEPTTPSARARGLRGIFLMGAATPIVKGGDFGFLFSCFQFPRDQQKMWDLASPLLGGECNVPLERGTAAKRQGVAHTRCRRVPIRSQLADPELRQLEHPDGGTPGHRQRDLRCELRERGGLRSAVADDHRDVLFAVRRVRDRRGVGNVVQTDSPQD